MTKSKRLSEEKPSSAIESPQADTLAQATVDDHLALLPAWEQAALRAAYHWPQGQPMTAEQFEENRRAVLKQEIK